VIIVERGEYAVYPQPTKHALVVKLTGSIVLVLHRKQKGTFLILKQSLSIIANR
jgi:hypothetical protein